MHEPARLYLGQGKAVRAGVEIDVREVRLDVLAHLDGALVKERLAVVEEIDAHERRTRLVYDPPEQIEVEHPGLPRARDAGFRSAARLLARDVARGRAFDVQP